MSGRQHAVFDVQPACAARSSDDMFLMNTLTDAQLVVSSDVAALLDRYRRTPPTGSTLVSTTSARAARAAAGQRLPRRRPRIGAAGARHVTSRVTERHVRAPRHGADDAAVQLRVRLLLPGRSRRLQQVRREDVARDRDRVGDWIERELDRVRPEKLTLTFFGGEPLLNLPVMYYLAERLHGAPPQARGIDRRSASSPTACC